MNKPELFLKFKEISKCGSTDIIQKYFHLLRNSDREGCTVLDIGSGPGNITHDEILPYFNAPVGKIVAIDVTNEMVDYANAHYGNETLSFELLDIGSEVPEKYVSYFDYVVSFLALQWIQDQRQLYANIKKVLKPNGQLLVSYVAQSTLYDMYSKVWSKPEYAPYITDAQKGISCFQKSTDPKQELEAIIEQAGFAFRMVKLEEIQPNDKSVENFKELLISIDPVYSNIPDHLKEKFMDDYIVEVVRKPGNGNYCLIQQLFVVYARNE